jgi:nucleotide-binding universal stress UspA family protein
MNKIAVLVDLSESGKPALMQARVLALNSGAELVVVHVVHDQVPNEIHENILDGYARPILGDGVRFSLKISHGNFMNEIPNVVQSIQPDLVVLCTHGIHGITQNLFGAHVLKLVQSLPFPCLVVQENSKIDTNGIKRILLPASPFADFTIKMKECARIAKIFDADVVYYEIDKYLGDTEDSIAENGKLAASYMEENKVSFKAVLEENTVMSLGHSQQTINYASDNQFQLICLSSNTHHEFMAMGKADKEKFLTNDKGIPVLCCG